MIAGNRQFLKNIEDSSGKILVKGDLVLDTKLFSQDIILFWKDLYDIALQGEYLQKEFHFSTESSSKKTWMQLNLNPIFDKAEIIGVACFGRDISESKMKDLEIIKAKEKAEESDRLKSAFLANMSHEIRTPMNGILGFAEVLKDSTLTNNEREEYLQIIEKSGLRMLNIINDIVDIAKIESGQMEVRKTSTDINEQMEFIYNFFRHEATSKGIELSLHLSLPSSEAQVITDREKLYAILTNLVKNAIKYTHSGSIQMGYHLQTSSGSATAEQKDMRYLLFYVKDSGIGIPENRQSAIFERFIQADITKKHAYQGAGLGLAISRAYVEMLEGKIWVESKEDDGSTFYFTIPYGNKNKKNTMASNEVYTSDTLVKKLNIIIAEDDESSAQLLSISVQKYGKQIIKVATGHEAVEMCHNHPETDLILMDIQMPEMDGYEATRRIRQFNSQVIIIAQTAYAIEGDQEKALSAGCNDYLAKPIRKERLSQFIEKHFGQ